MCLLLVVGGDDGEEVGAVGLMVGGDDVGHAGFELDAYLLASLMAIIGYRVVLYVCCFEESHVYKGHSEGIVAEEEDVACELQRLFPVQVGFFYFSYVGCGNRAFDGGGMACICFAERVSLLSAAGIDGFVVDGTQASHVARDGVGTDGFLAQPLLVVVDQFLADGVEGNDGLAGKVNE